MIIAKERDIHSQDTNQTLFSSSEKGDWFRSKGSMLLALIIRTDGQHKYQTGTAIAPVTA